MNISKDVPLIVIDVQKAFDVPSWGNRNNPSAEGNIERLVQLWRTTNRPVFFVKHVSNNEKSLFYKGSMTSEFKIQPLPHELIIEKTVNSAFIGTNLEGIIRDLNCPYIVITGLTTNHCVETTTRMAGNLGFNPIFVTDATATFDRTGPNGKLYTADLIHEVTIANLHREFATILTTDTLITLA